MARLSNLTERGLETQRQLRDVLMSLVIEKGYEHVSVRDITERAGIDRTTFYLHFKDKDDLFEKSQRWIVDELIVLRTRGSGPFPGISTTFEHMAQNAKKYLAIYRSEGTASRKGMLQEYIAQSITPILEHLLKENGIHQKTMIEPVAHYLTGALRSLSRWWLEAGIPKSPEEMSELFLRLASRGIQSLKDE